MTLPFRSFSNCESKGIIYIIFCSKCSSFYIGESGRKVSERMYEHLNNIKKFKKDLINSIILIDKLSEVAVHFNRSGHIIERDFRFCIFESNLINSEIRKSIETDLINIFKISSNLIPGIEITQN